MVHPVYPSPPHGPYLILRQGELLVEMLELDLTVVLLVVGYALVTGFIVFTVEVVGGYE